MCTTGDDLWSGLWSWEAGEEEAKEGGTSLHLLFSCPEISGPDPFFLSHYRLLQTSHLSPPRPDITDNHRVTEVGTTHHSLNFLSPNLPPPSSRQPLVENNTVTDHLHSSFGLVGKLWNREDWGHCKSTSYNLLQGPQSVAICQVF